MNKVFITGLFSDPIIMCLSPGSRLVYICLANYILSSKPIKQVVPVHVMCEMTGASEKQIQNAYQNLEQSGIIEDRGKSRIRLIRGSDHFGIHEDLSVPETPEKKEMREFTQELCDYWKDVFNAKRTPRATAKRQSMVMSLMNKGFSLQDIKTAINGCRKSDWHVENGYNSLENIMSKVEKFERHLERGAKTLKREQRRVILQSRGEHIERLRNRKPSES